MGAAKKSGSAGPNGPQRVEMRWNITVFRLEEELARRDAEERNPMELRVPVETRARQLAELQESDLGVQPLGRACAASGKCGRLSPVRWYGDGETCRLRPGRAAPRNPKLPARAAYSYVRK
jgi:hypothetical protein